MVRALSIMIACTAALAANAQEDQMTPPVAPPAVDAAGNPCWNNFDDIRAVEFSNTTDYSIHRKYILCPDTIFSMGYLNQQREENGGELFEGGQFPIIAQPNSTFWCGIDGKSSNNCRMRGGDAHFLVLNVNDFGVPNVNIRGVTFDSALSFSLLLDRPGDARFDDCIFENNQNIGMIIGQIKDVGTRRRYRNLVDGDDVMGLPEDVQNTIDYIRDQFEVDHYGYRLLQEEEDSNSTETDGNSTETDGDATENNGNSTKTDADNNTNGGNTTEPEEPELEPEVEPLITFTGIFDRCVFQNNYHGESRPGVFTITNSRLNLVLNECRFENNDFTNSKYDFGFAVYSPGFVNATNNCFIQNNFPATTFFLFEPLSRQSYTYNNYFQTDTPSECEIFESPQVEGQNGTCREMDNNTDVCAIVPDTLAPTLSPTSSPTLVPPTMAPVAPQGSGAVSAFGVASFVVASFVAAIASVM